MSRTVYIYTTYISISISAHHAHITHHIICISLSRVARRPAPTAHHVRRGRTNASAALQCRPRDRLRDRPTGRPAGPAPLLSSASVMRGGVAQTQRRPATASLRARRLQLRPPPPPPPSPANPRRALATGPSNAPPTLTPPPDESKKSACVGVLAQPPADRDARQTRTVRSPCSPAVNFHLSPA